MTACSTAVLNMTGKIGKDENKNNVLDLGNSLTSLAWL